MLDGLPALADLLGDVLDLDDRVRLDDAPEVLLEERVVQRREVRADRDVGRELCGDALAKAVPRWGGKGRTVLIVLQCLLEVGEVAVLVRASDGTHTLDVP